MAAAHKARFNSFATLDTGPRPEAPPEKVVTHHPPDGGGRRLGGCPACAHGVDILEEGNDIWNEYATFVKDSRDSMDFEDFLAQAMKEYEAIRAECIRLGEIPESEIPPPLTLAMAREHYEKPHIRTAESMKAAERRRLTNILGALYGSIQTQTVTKNSAGQEVIEKSFNAEVLSMYPRYSKLLLDYSTEKGGGAK